MLWGLSAPSQAIQLLASKVTSTGGVLPIQPPRPNAAWSLDILGRNCNAKT